MIKLAHAPLFAALAATATGQIPCWNANVGASLGLVDESMSAAQSLGFAFPYAGTNWTDIQVCDNGYITLGATGGSADFTPNANTLVADPFGRICPFWVDLDPSAAGSGDVFYNAVAANGGVPAHAIITWVDVYEFFGSTPHTFQLVLVSGGAIRCSYDVNLSANTNSWLVGASPGNAVTLNPVSFTNLPILTSGNPTLHQEDLIGSGSPLAGVTLDWAPDGIGGFTITQVLGCATSNVYGTGCVGRFTSFYEWFTTTPSIDLSNSAIEMLFTGNSYVVTASSATFVAPTAAAANLNLTDDSETTITLAGALSYPGGSTTTLNVGSNGQISTASNGAAFDFSPTPIEFLNWTETTWAVWHDFIPGPTGAGTVWFEEVSNLTIVTWDAVVGYVGQSAGITPSTFQFQFDRSTGHVTLVFLAMDTISVSTFAGGEGWVVGFTTGGTSLDPGSSDLSTLLGAGNLATSAADLAPLALEGSAPPAVNTTISLDVSGMTPNTVFGGVLLGLLKIDPGISLTTFGMAGCFQYNDQAANILFFPMGASTFSTAFAVPNIPGVMITAQAAAYDPSAGLTPLGAVSSNGLELSLGQ